jgi:exonuclease VII large subunit
MGTWDRILAALRREKRDVSEAVDEAVERANATLDRRERELRATPAEKMAFEQERIDENDAELEAIRRRIEDGR